jgi:hypothetical protein
MATLEELRQQRINDIKNRKKSLVVDDAQQRRIEEIKRRSRTTYIEPPKEIQETITGSSTTESLARSAAVNVLPVAAGALGMAGTMAAAGSIVPGIGTIGGFVAGLGAGVVGSILTKKAQDKALEVVKGEDWKRNFDATLVEDRKEHPFATLLGETAPQLLTFKPSPTTLKQALSLATRVMTKPKSLTSYTKTLQGKTELDALMNVAIGSGINASLETYQQIRQGDDLTMEGALRVVAAGVLGGVISDPNRIGVKLGFKPTGDAVIEEYNKFGSKTPAAKIVTHGDIPVLDRSVDSLVLSRKELAAILRGESEGNRFTNPRILQAERIAGTIDKDVTPDSDLNVYRLDGRSGPLRVGERMTANPHIADVYGGKVRPETIVKAGDLVRTSQGDYVYVPQSTISARPKLPPVTTAVEKSVREQVVSREKLEINALKAKGKEAMRVREEPARLKAEAEARAEKKKQEYEALLKKEREEQELQALRLEENVKKIEAEKQAKIAEEKKRVISEKVAIEAEKQAKIAEEKKRVISEKVAIEKARDKELEPVVIQRRKELNDALLEHVKKMASAKTKLQKTKENIRYTNKKASIQAKAIKAQKKIREQAEVSKSKVVDKTKEIKEQAEVAKSKVVNKTKEIKKQTKESIADTKKTIRELRKVKKPKVEKVVAREKADGGQPQTKESGQTGPRAMPAKEQPAPKERITTIGSKQVKSESIIKNAVQEARQISKQAQELDTDVTYQMGTTFVEQRKLSAEIVAERGFDDALKFAINASEAELNKMGVNRSALYETLYKTAISEEQFGKYRDDLEELALLVSDEVSVAAQQSSLHRLATQNDPFRRIVRIKKVLLENEKKSRGSVFDKEVDELYTRLKEAGTDDDINKIINENLC